MINQLTLYFLCLAFQHTIGGNLKVLQTKNKFEIEKIGLGLTKSQCSRIRISQAPNVDIFDNDPVLQTSDLYHYYLHGV